ncbi:MAG: hypothetical protein RLZZ293_888, partial [Pseudomonadota bacterium]
IMAIPLILWIGFAPNIVLHNLKLNYEVFIICQIIAIGGLSISSIFVQFLAGKWKFYHLIKRGSYISLSGIILALIGHSSIYVLASGLCVYSIGVGLGNGSMIRITMRSQKNSSQAMVTSLMTFLQTLVFAIVIEAANHILALYNYSPLSFCLACLLSVIIGFMLTRKFAKRHKDREWE